MKKIKKTDQNLVELIHRLRKEKKSFWKKVAEMLSRPRKMMVAVNISKLDRYGKEGAVILIPGKVLGDGKMTKKMTVAALRFSESAKKTINETGGKTMALLDLVESKKEPKDILLIS